MLRLGLQEAFVSDHHFAILGLIPRGEELTVSVTRLLSTPRSAPDPLDAFISAALTSALSECRGTVSLTPLVPISLGPIS